MENMITINILEEKYRELIFYPHFTLLTLSLPLTLPSSYLADAGSAEFHPSLVISGVGETKLDKLVESRATSQQYVPPPSLVSAGFKWN